MVGYTRLTARDGAAPTCTLTDYREEIAMLVRQHLGRVVDAPGDNLLAGDPCAGLLRSAQSPAPGIRPPECGISVGRPGGTQRGSAATAMNRAALAAALVIATGVLLTLIAYRPALEVGFYFDDQANITHASAIHWREFSLHGVKRVLAEAASIRRPVANLSFAINHLYWGPSAFWYHAVNVAIHLAVGVSLGWVCVLVCLTRRPASCRASPTLLISASLAATLFLLHPLNTQAVTYVVQRMTSLATLLFLLSFGAYLSVRLGRCRNRTLGLVAAVIFFLLACGSKEIACMLPIVIAIYELCFFREEAWRALRRLEPGRLRAGSVALAIGVALALALVVGLAADAIWSHIEWTGTLPRRTFSGQQRVLTEPRVMFFYLSLLLWPAPSRLNLDHDFAVSTSFFEPWTTSLAIASWLGLGLLGIWLARRRPQIGFPLLAYYSLHLIESGPISLELVFEHRMYLPMTAVAIGAAHVMAQLRGHRQLAAFVIAGLATLPAAHATYVRNELWTRPVDFYRDSATKSPHRFRPNSILALELVKLGRYEESLEVFDVVLSLAPDYAVGHTRAAIACLNLGREEQARFHLQRATEVEQPDPDAFYNLALLFARDGQTQRALEMLRKFVALNPQHRQRELHWARERLRNGLPRTPGSPPD